jgi:D-3-phosphoglycerate dehydrogenase
MDNNIKKKIICVILARGGSKGIPYKNIFPINNHPLISYSIEAARKSSFLTCVYVSTDDKKIAKQAKLYGAKIPFLRPKKYATDIAPSVDALKNTVEKIEKINKVKYEYIIELPCVSPLRDEEDIDNVLIKLIESKYDSIISYVNTGEKHPIRLKRLKNQKITNFCKEYKEPPKGSRRQDFEPCYIRNGAIYAMTRDCLFRQNSREGKNSFPYLMSDEKSVNIDNKFDLLVAKLLIENGYCKNVPKKKEHFIKSSNYAKTYDVLITARFLFNKDLISKFTKNFNCIIINSSDINLIKKYLKTAKVWLCSPAPVYKIDSDLLKIAKDLKVIITPSTGTTHIDTNFCKKNNIIIQNILKTPLIKKIHASSEFSFSLMLALIKNIPQAIRAVKSGHWRNEEDILRSRELFGKNVGIIGYGRIGKNLTRYCKSFNMKVNIFDPLISKVKQKNLNHYNDLKEMLSISDIVFLCISYSEKNYKFMNFKYFRHMKKNSIFVNTSRGEAICESSLIKSIKSKRINKSAVDVVSNEQEKIDENILIKYSKKNENLLITPHMAGLTFESETKAAQQCFEILNSYKGVYI